MLDREPACWSWPVPPLPDLTLGEALRFVAFHDGRCAACSDRRSVVVVDHDHGNGLVRGFLCARCNTAEGHGGGHRFDLYRRHNPASILGYREPYGDDCAVRLLLRAERRGRRLAAPVAPVGAYAVALALVAAAAEIDRYPRIRPGVRRLAAELAAPEPRQGAIRDLVAMVAEYLRTRADLPLSAELAAAVAAA